MPYKIEKIKISGTKYDRRSKLSDEQRAEIQALYASGEYSQRKLAEKYKVSRRLIQFVTDPEKQARNSELAKINKKEGRYRPSKESWAATIREHRRYKHELYLNGEIK